MVDIEVTSIQTIQPSSSTPENLRTFLPSLLDLRAPTMYVPLILFYSSSIDGEKTENVAAAAKSHHLQSSLSKALTRFYPLAGRFKEENSVECNDQGVDFFDAQVSCEMSKFLGLPNVEEFLYELLPCNFSTSKSGSEVLLAIQVNHFRCGGIAIGVSISHLVADTATMATFINNWAAIASGADSEGPRLDSASLFPPPTRKVERINMVVTTEGLSSKRFVFTESNLALLKEKSNCTYSHVGKRITTVQAVPALLWRCFIRATKKEGTGAREMVSIHAVNIRPRMDPPLPAHMFGNLLVVATSGVSEKDLNVPGCLEEKLREAFTQIDAGYVRELQGPNGDLKILESTRILLNYDKFSDMNVDLCGFSSRYRFPLYEADFGWGRPLWVSPAPFPVKNSILLIGRRSKEDGIEAWLTLEKEDMDKFEVDEELRSFASNPVII